MSQKKKTNYTPKAVEDFDSSVLAEEIIEAIVAEELTEVDEPIVSKPESFIAGPVETHVVAKGETLSSIAHKYCPADMDVDQFYRHLNILNGRPEIAVGKVIKLFGGK